MTSRFSVFSAVVLAGALAFACGPRNSSSESNTTAEVTRPDDAPLASSLRVAVDTSEGVQLTLHVTNFSSKGVELTFPSGQTHDFAILDAGGREVWRWSEGRMFTQALQTRQLGKGETVSYEDEWNVDLPSGRYIAVAMLTSDNHPVESRVEFETP